MSLTIQVEKIQGTARAVNRLLIDRRNRIAEIASIVDQFHYLAKRLSENPPQDDSKFAHVRKMRSDAQRVAVVARAGLEQSLLKARASYLLQTVLFHAAEVSVYVCRSFLEKNQASNGNSFSPETFRAEMKAKRALISCENTLSHAASALHYADMLMTESFRDVERSETLYTQAMKMTN